MSEHREGKSWKTSTRLPFDASNLKSWEWWLNKVGIALLLLGVALLFKLSAERGWLSHPLRVGFGLALGGGLLALGLCLYEGRRSFAQVLLGGGVGVLYTTGFAAFELYGLVPYPVAFAFMVAVTLLAFSLSLRQDDPSLSVIGVLGGLGTPFVLYSGAGGLGGLVLYTCLVLSGAGAIYLYKGWRSLLYSSFAGGWAVFLVGYLAGIAGLEASAADRVALEAGVLFAWLLFWFVPLTREVLHLGNPGRWPKPEPGQMLRESPIARAIIGGPGSDRAVSWTRGASHAHLLSVSAPLLALAFTRGIWTLPGEALGLIALGMSMLYTAAALMLRRAEGRRERGFYYTQGLVALLLATLGLVLVLAELSVDALFFTVAAEAAILHLLSRRLQDCLISVQAHILSALATGWLFSRIFDGLAETAFGADLDYTPVLNSGAIVDLCVVVLTFGAARVVLPEDLGSLYRIVAHAALFCWFSAELLSLPDGGDWTILVWALYAVALRLISRRSSVSENAEVYGAVAHGIAGLTGVWLLGRLFAEVAFLLLPGVDVAAFGLGDAVNLALITLAFSISPLVGATKAIYRIFGHAALLCWLSATLGALPDGGDLIFAAWIAYAAGLHLLSRRLPGWGTTIGSHALYAIVGLWLVLRFGAGTVDVLLGSSSSGVGFPFLDLTAIAAAWGVSLLYPGSGAAYVYRLAATAAFSFWLMRELLAFQDGDDYLIIVWSIYAVALHLASERLRDGSLSVAGHAQFFLAGVFLLGRLLFGVVEPASVGTPFLSVDALADLTAILLAAVASFVGSTGILASTYRVAVHVALLAFVWRELSVLPGSAGDALVTVVWGFYAAGLLVWGLRGDRTGLTQGGGATLFLVVGKLFLVDLAEVEAIWRVLLFLGFGGLFLALSYYLRFLWCPNAKENNGTAVPTMERNGGVS